MSGVSGDSPVQLVARLPDWSAGGLPRCTVLPVCPCVVSFFKFHGYDPHDLLRTSSRGRHEDATRKLLLWNLSFSVDTHTHTHTHTRPHQLSLITHSACGGHSSPLGLFVNSKRCSVAKRYVPRSDGSSTGTNRRCSRLGNADRWARLPAWGFHIIIII